jgi:DNA replication protein DnaC
MADLLLADPHIPTAFRDIGYQDFRTTGTDGPIRRGIYKTIREWRPTKERPNLLLYGKPGLGKTFLAVASLNERQRLWEFRTKTGKDLPPESVRVLRQNFYPVYFVQLAELITMHLRSFNLRDKDDVAWAELTDLLEGLSDRAKWLVIDDVGKEHATGTDFSIDTFDLLVRNRFNNGLYTIFTSNMPPSRWESCYSESMRSFIERTSEIIKFTD